MVTGLTVIVDPPDVPPPGEALKTVTVLLPAVRSEAGMAAVIWFADTKLVVRVEPFQLTTEPL